MTLIPWRAKRDEEQLGLAPLRGFRSEMDRLFDSFLREAFGGGDRPPGEFGEWGPPLDIEETDKEVHIRAEIPGVKPDDLQLSIQGHALVISGEKKESTERKEGGVFHQERHFGFFRREVPLPVAVDESNVEAQYQDGVLQVTLKKAQEALPKRIPVKAS